MILTIPWNTWQGSTEHYPWMISYSMQLDQNGQYFVIGKDSRGDSRIILDPIFHGGPGNALEMRKINIHVLIHELHRCGFREIVVHQENRTEYGIRRADGVVGVVTAKNLPEKLNLEESLAKKVYSLGLDTEIV